MALKESKAGAARGWAREGLALLLCGVAGAVAAQAIALLGWRMTHRPGMPAAEIIALVGFAVSALIGRMAGVAGRVARFWPYSSDVPVKRRRGTVAFWTLLALVAAFQSVRLSAFMSDPTLVRDSAFPFDPSGSGHMCMAAYVRAGELARDRIDNLYEPKLYAKGQTSTVSNINSHLTDPFQYPPPFLLLPRLGLALSNDFLALRTVWFVLQWFALIGLVLALPICLGGRAGEVSGLATLALFASIPFLFNLQWGQAHVLSVALAVAGMLAFEHKRLVLGGGLLGAAIVMKLAPGILVIDLLARRKWREAAFATVGCIVWFAIGWSVLGSKPFVAFFRYQLPRLATGEAFSSFLGDPFALAGNNSIYAIPYKLAALGLAAGTPGTSRLLAKLFVLALCGGVIYAARRARGPVQLAQGWLAQLSLATLASGAAPWVYTAAVPLWLLALLAPEVQRRRSILLFVIAWIVIDGLPRLPSARAAIVAWLPAQLLVVSLGAWVLFRRPTSSDLSENAKSAPEPSEPVTVPVRS